MPIFYLMLQMACIASSGESLLCALSEQLDCVRRRNGLPFVVDLCSCGAMWVLAILPRDLTRLWCEHAQGLLLLLTWTFVAAPAQVVCALNLAVGEARYGHLPALITSAAWFSPFPKRFVR